MIQTLTDFAIHGTWIPAIPAGMTKPGLADFTI